MSTATLDGASGPTPDDVIRRTVKALRSAYDVDARVLAQHLGISRNSLYNRLNGSAGWMAAEIVGMAYFFGCEVNDFYTGNVRIDQSANSPAQRSSNERYQAESTNVVTLFPQVSGHKDHTVSPRLGHLDESTRAS